MSLSRKRCAPSTADLPFFFSHGHHEIAEEARHLAMKTIAPEEDRLAAGPALSHDALGDRCRTIARQLAMSRLLEPCVPASMGGLTLGRPETIDIRAICLVRESLAWASGLAEFVFAMQGLGSYPITLAGNTAQREEFLPPVLEGRSLAAFAITEPDAGSDVAALTSTARREGEQYVLDGTKTFISNAGIAGHYVVFAKTTPAAGSKGITAFIVRPSDPGFEFAGPIHLIADHPIGTIRMNRLRVPASRRLGVEGDGFRIAMATLDAFRATVGAASLGMARRALDEALTRVSTRQQFGQAISEFQNTKMYLAEMATELDAARLLVYRAAYLRDHGVDRVTMEASMAKLAATESAQMIIDRALQLHGGSGVVRGSTVERLYREIRALRIYEGTTEIQKVVIAGILLGGERARANEARAQETERARDVREQEQMVQTNPLAGARARPGWDGDEPTKVSPRAPKPTVKIPAMRPSPPPEEPDTTARMRSVRPDKKD